MTGSSLAAVVRALNDAGAEYLIVGGLAVVAHGYVRFTADLDLLLNLTDSNLRRALPALRRLGYRPRAPVALEDFLSEESRHRWRDEKQMTVFSLYSPEHAATEIDIRRAGRSDRVEAPSRTGTRSPGHPAAGGAAEGPG